MKSFFKKKLQIFFAFCFILLYLVPSSANSKKEFITSCTYGVLAGTLVGAASLAFTDQPGENLQRVARGASLGLYAGIALGFYVMSLKPGDFEEDLPPLPPVEGQPQEDSPYIEDYDDESSLAPKVIMPLISKAGQINGGYAIWNLYSF